MSQPAPKPDRTTSISLDSSVFVGRQQEMAALEAALHDALFGQGRLVMLAGEPGIGKTRTAQELAAVPKNTAFRCCGAGATRKRAPLPTGPGSAGQAVRLGGGVLLR